MNITEAPETIGTALKTVLSRMRELTDYGKTLEDGMDVNRVAKALDNIGISLMDTNGQFRDMESVLKDVGAKWDDLNTNQQANVAVALAGTRQQSRLIAMMQDFDRTLELTDTAASSYGATLAQQAKYMEGLEAATTRLTSAWQALIEKLVDSNFVIGTINTLTGLIDGITQNTWLLIPVLTVIALKTLGIVTAKQAEHRIAKQKLKVELQEQKIALQQRKVALQRKKTDLEERKRNLEGLLTDKDRLKTAIETAKIKAEQNGDMVSAAKYAAMLTDDAAMEAEIRSQIVETEVELQQTNYEIAVTTGQIAQNSWDTQLAMGGIKGGLLSLLSPLGSIITAFITINALRKTQNALQKVSMAQTDVETAKEKVSFIQKLKNAGAAMAESAAKIPVAGWVIAAAILAAIGIAIGVSVAAANGAFDSTDDKVNDTEEALNKLQADLYNTTQQAKKIKSLGDEFESLSSKIVKSTDDLARMKEIAQQVNDEAGENVVNLNDSAEAQMASINAYYAKKAREIREKNDELNKTLGEGLKDVGKKQEDRDKYIQSMQTSEAGRNTIRTLGAANIEGYDELGAQTQSAVLELAIQSLPETLTEEGIDWTVFANKFSSDLIGALDTAFEDNSFTSFNEFFQSGLYDALDDAEKEILRKAVPILDTLEAFGKDAASAIAQGLDDIGYTTDEVNQLYEAVQRISGDSSVGQHFADLFADLAADDEATDLAKRRAAYEQLVDDTRAYAEAANELMAMNETARMDWARQYQEASDAEVEQHKLAGDKKWVAQHEASVKYLALIEERDLVQGVITEAQKAYKDAQKGSDDKDKMKEQQDIIDQNTEKLNDLNDAIANFSWTTEETEDAVSDLSGLLGTVPFSEVSDSVTRLSSQMERLGKTVDFTKMSFNDLMDLLKDYPELAGAVNRGFMTAEEKMQMYQKTFDETSQTLVDDMANIQSEMNKQYGLGSTGNTDLDTLFTEAGRDLRERLARGSYKDLMEAYNLDEKTAQAIFGKIQEYNQYESAHLFLTQRGVAGLLDAETQELWEKATSRIGQLEVLKKKYDEILEDLDPNSQEYKDILQARNQMARDYVQELQKELAKSEDNINKYMGIVLTGTNGQQYQLSDFVREVDGEIVILADEIAKLDEASQLKIKTILPELKTEAEARQEQVEELRDAAESLAQAYIDAEAQATEAIIDELEKRQELYEDYFDKIDALEEDEERKQSRESIISQLQALAGGADAATNQKVKELRQQLNELNEEALEAEKEAARDALLDKLATEEEEMNEYLDKVNDSLGVLTRAIMMDTAARLGDKTITVDQLMAAVASGNLDIDKWLNFGMAQYASGGMVNYTGPAMLHGTPAKPESVLNAQDTQNLLDLLDVLRGQRMASLAALERMEVDTNGAMGGVTIEEINIHTDHLDNEQDFGRAGTSLAEEFVNAMRRRGLNLNVKN